MSVLINCVFLCLCVIPLYAGRVFFKTDSGSCRARDQCIPIKQCEPYMELVRTLEKPLQPSIVGFLRAQHCGFQEGYPKVCCSLLPKNLRALKYSRSQARPQVNTSTDKWFSLTGNDGPATSSIEFDMDFADETTTVKPHKSNVDKKIREKAEALNRAFAMYDMFDFVRRYDTSRRRRSTSIIKTAC